MNPPGAGSPLEGPRLRLRPLRETDLDLLLEWYNDPETVAPFDRFALDDREGLLRAVRAAPHDPRSLAPRFLVERREGGPPLGVVGHYQPHPVLSGVDVWYVLGDRPSRGQGFGSEAVRLLVDYLFRSPTLARVGATCDVENQPSLRLLAGLGFQREGTLRAALHHHAKWHDVAVFGVTRAEWGRGPGRTGPGADREAGAPASRPPSTRSRGS